MQQALKLLLLLIIFFQSSCASKEKMIFQLQGGDLFKNCVEIQEEMAEIKNQFIPKQKNKKKLRILKNIGIIIISAPAAFIPLFFIDFSSNEKENIKSYEKRIEHLEMLLRYKECKD